MGATAPAAGNGRGMALFVQGEWGTYIAQVADVEVTGGRSDNSSETEVVCSGGLRDDRDQPGHRAGADRKAAVVFGISGALWGEITVKERPRRAVELQRLSSTPHRRDSAKDRRPPDTQRRSPQRHQRARHSRHGAGAGQRGVRRDRGGSANCPFERAAGAAFLTFTRGVPIVFAWQCARGFSFFPPLSPRRRSSADSLGRGDERTLRSYTFIPNLRSDSV